MAAQALLLVVCIGFELPRYVDYLTRPLDCAPGAWCLDFRGLGFLVSAMFLGPPALVLLIADLLWRGTRLWPAVVVVVVDVVAIGFMLWGVVAATTGHWATDGYGSPSISLWTAFVLIPAVVTILLLIALLRRRDSGVAPT